MNERGVTLIQLMFVTFALFVIVFHLLPQVPRQYKRVHVKGTISEEIRQMENAKCHGR